MLCIDILHKKLSARGYNILLLCFGVSYIDISHGRPSENGYDILLHCLCVVCIAILHGMLSHTYSYIASACRALTKYMGG